MLCGQFFISLILGSKDKVDYYMLGRVGFEVPNLVFFLVRYMDLFKRCVNLLFREFLVFAVYTNSFVNRS